MSSRQFNKYVSENRTFSIDWTNRLSNVNDGAADTIATSAWDIDAGLTNVTDSISGDDTIVRVSGGTANTSYQLENTITCTTSGYTLIEYIQVYVTADPVT